MLSNLAKKGFASAIIATSLCFSFVGSVADAAPSSKSFATQSTSENVKRTYALVNDASNTLSSEQVQELEKRLGDIQGRARTETIGLKIYSFIYNDQKPVSEVSDGLIASYGTESDVSPIIFVYNKSTQDYRFVIDSRIATYASKGYLEDLIDKNLVANKSFNATILEDTIIRFNTVIATAFITNTTEQENLKFDGVEVKEGHFKIADFGQTTNQKNTGHKSILSNENKSNESKNEDDMYILGGIILAIITAGVVVFAKRKKTN